MLQPTAITILVVDDHFVVRSGLAASLGLEADLTVVAEAECGEAALTLYRQHRPAVVLMDLMLTGLNGIGATEQLRSEFPEAKVIIFSTFARNEEIYQAMRAGAKGYLLKTAPRAELLTAIRTVSAGNSYLPPLLTERLAERLTQSELTPREREILQLIRRGLSNKEIGAALFIAEDTVKRHVSNLMQKLQAGDRAQAVAEALRRGLITLD
ncbi:response regulator [Singulisphaera sp. GP187]|uniref:response regulator n=1 Tax=Singulisphaera sp. GP187 TaxID=1882752 RepID=UPI0020B14994|nr:response regulator transcription factor [Singulisphaera sp. GP187]